MYAASKPPEPPKPAPKAEPSAKPEPSPNKELIQRDLGGAVTKSDDGPIVDYTKIPRQMEQKFDELDEDSALRPTIITAGNTWEKKFQKALLSAPESTTLGKEEQGRERNKVCVCVFCLRVFLSVILAVFVPCSARLSVYVVCLCPSHVCC